METPEEFFGRLRLYKRHVALSVSGVVFLVLGMLAPAFDFGFGALALGLVLSGACEIGAGRSGLRCGRTVLRGWSFSSESSDGASEVGEGGAYGYSTRALETMSPHEALAFARRSGYALIVAGALEVASGIVFAFFLLLR